MPLSLNRACFLVTPIVLFLGCALPNESPVELSALTVDAFINQQLDETGLTHSINFRLSAPPRADGRCHVLDAATTASFTTGEVEVGRGGSFVDALGEDVCINMAVNVTFGPGDLPPGEARDGELLLERAGESARFRVEDLASRRTISPSIPFDELRRGDSVVLTVTPGTGLDRLRTVNFRDDPTESPFPVPATLVGDSVDIEIPLDAPLGSQHLNVSLAVVPVTTTCAGFAECQNTTGGFFERIPVELAETL